MWLRLLLRRAVLTHVAAVDISLRVRAQACSVCESYQRSPYGGVTFVPPFVLLSTPSPCSTHDYLSKLQQLCWREPGTYDSLRTY
jgi:hypothetical protein